MGWRATKDGVVAAAGWWRRVGFRGLGMGWVWWWGEREGWASGGGGRWLGGPERFVTDGDGVPLGRQRLREEQDNPVGWGLAPPHRGLARCKYASSW